MFYFFLSSGMSFSVISSLFYGYFKLKKLESLYYNIEKKLRYIEYELDLNNNYRNHHDRRYSSLLERIRVLENMTNVLSDNLQTPSSKKRNIESYNTPNQFTIIDYDDNNNNRDKNVNDKNVNIKNDNDNNSDIYVDNDSIKKNYVPRVKPNIEIEIDREFDSDFNYMDDYYSNPNHILNDKIIVKRSSNSFLDLTKKMIFGYGLV